MERPRPALLSRRYDEAIVERPRRLPVHLIVDITVHGPIMTQAGQTMAVDWMGNVPSADLTARPIPATSYPCYIGASADRSASARRNGANPSAAIARAHDPTYHLRRTRHSPEHARAHFVRLSMCPLFVRRHAIKHIHSVTGGILSWSCAGVGGYRRSFGA